MLWEAKGLGLRLGVGVESRRKQTLERGGGCLLMEVKLAASRALPPVHMVMGSWLMHLPLTPRM